MQLHNPLSVPDDGLRWICLGLAALVAWRGARELDRARVPRWLWWLAPLSAGVLSAGYIAHYLRGGPRIIDATAYYLQARTFAEGMLSVPLPEPEHAVMGRFLVRAHTETPSAAVIFPPGYPAVLATGFWLGAPLAVGPVIAAALVVATMALAEVAAELMHATRPGVMVVYAGLSSLLCAALRYHTADTMAHGLAALCVTVALWAALRLGRPARRPWLDGLALGLSGGLLFATRPASALALAAALAIGVAGHAAWRRPPPTVAAGLLAGAAGPLALWFVYQHHVTGSWSSTAQSAYYAASDGPLGCFRYGFGAGIGCHGEHGTFVDDNLASGYGVVAAAKTSGRRLMMHVSDATGFAPAFVAVLIGGVVAAKHTALRPLAAVVVAQAVAYAPFYFDGNYPGGGARMFADVIPVEHVLVALGLGSWRLRSRAVAPERAGAWLLAATLLGFAVHLGAQHRQLRDREGGRPMFEPAALASIDGQLFIDTDHGFNLAFDPADPQRVARLHHDELDQLAWDAAGRPRAHLYLHSFDETEPPRVLAVSPSPPDELHIEGESLWPAVSQRRSWAFPRHVSASCSSRGRVLMITPEGDGGEVRLALPAAVGGSALWARIIPTAESTSIKLTTYNHRGAHSVATALVAGADRCHLIGPLDAPPAAGSLGLGVTTDARIGLDWIEAREKR